MNRAFISLGSNIGNRLANLNKSYELLNILAGKILQSSSLYETAPWQMALQTEYFINQVIQIETNLTAEVLLETLLDIELRMGRVRTTDKGYQSRIIDLDILFYNNDHFSTQKLTIPHPLLHQRKFVLVPMAELAPNFIHPTLNKSITALLGECMDTTKVEGLLSK